MKAKSAETNSGEHIKIKMDWCACVQRAVCCECVCPREHTLNTEPWRCPDLTQRAGRGSAVYSLHKLLQSAVQIPSSSRGRFANHVVDVWAPLSFLYSPCLFFWMLLMMISCCVFSLIVVVWGLSDVNIFIWTWATTFPSFFLKHTHYRWYCHFGTRKKKQFLCDFFR